MQIGHKIIHLDTVDSTNNYTANLIKKDKIVHGTVILADEQSAGKGQRGATWLSGAGENVLLSVFIAPDNLSVENQYVLTYVASISILKVLRKIGISAEIKWPNDIYVKRKKIAGILIENSLIGGRINTSIIGIGLNVNQVKFSALNATSIKMEKSEFMSIDNIVFMLIFELNTYWEKAQNGEIAFLRDEYLKNLYLLNQKSIFEDSNGIFNGTIKGVSAKGLLIMDNNGKEMQYDLKQIKFIDQNTL